MSLQLNDNGAPSPTQESVTLIVLSYSCQLLLLLTPRL